MRFVTLAVEFALGTISGAATPPLIAQDQRYEAVTFKLGPRTAD